MIRICTDAAFNPRTLEAGIGIVINVDKKNLNYKYYLHQIKDNHVGEFLACLISLDIVSETYPPSTIIQYQTDSKILIDSLEKKFAKNQTYQSLLDQIIVKSQQFELFFAQWIPESQNRGADSIARQALFQQGKNSQQIFFDGWTYSVDQN